MQPLILPPQSQPLALPNNQLTVPYYLFLQAIRDAVSRGAEMVQFGTRAERIAFDTVGLPNAALWFETDTSLLYQWRVIPGVSMGWVRVGVGKYAVAFTAATSVTVTHNLGTSDVSVELWDAGGNQLIAETCVTTSSNVVTVTFGAAQTGRVVVMG